MVNEHSTSGAEILVQESKTGSLAPSFCTCKLVISVLNTKTISVVFSEIFISEFHCPASRVSEIAEVNALK